MVRDIALSVLRRHGYVVISAQKAGEALLICEACRATPTTTSCQGVLDSGIAFFQKPITPATLTRKVREVLDGTAS